MTEIMKSARLAALGVALALGGCVTAENSLSQNDIASMKLTGVNVSFTPNSFVLTPNGDSAYAAAKGIPEGQMLSVARTPEYRDYVRKTVGAEIKGSVEQAMAGRLNGSRPVRLEIVVEHFKVPSVMSSVLIGGDPVMTAAATLVDARTGAVILTNPEMHAFLASGHGIIGTAVQAAVDSARKTNQEEMLVARFSQEYRDWLTHGA
jgi:Family of unknown function (DUF6778)